MTTQHSFFLSDSKYQRPVHTQGFHRSPSSSCQSNENETVPPKVLSPKLTSWIVQRHLITALRINHRLTRGFAQGTRHTSQGEILGPGFSTGGARDNVVYVERRFLSLL